MGQKSEHQLSANSPKSPPQEQHLLTHLSPPKLCSTQGSGRKGSNLYTLLRSSHPKPQEHHPTGSKSPAAPEMHRVRQRETKAPTDDMGKPQQCVNTPHPPQPSSSPGLPWWGTARFPLPGRPKPPHLMLWVFCGPSRLPSQTEGQQVHQGLRTAALSSAMPCWSQRPAAQQATGDWTGPYVGTEPG